MQLKKILLIFAVACVAVLGHVTADNAVAADDSVYEWGPWGRQVTPAAGPQLVAPNLEPATLGYRPGDNDKVTPKPIPLNGNGGPTDPGPGGPVGGGTNFGITNPGGGGPVGGGTDLGITNPGPGGPVGGGGPIGGGL